jgi:hypothetical protein
MARRHQKPTHSPPPPPQAHESSTLLQTSGFSSVATARLSGTPTAAVPRYTPPPTMHSKHSTPQVPQTPSVGNLVTACSSAVSAFSTVKVHTAKCSECDKRNMETMRRCPGCTFQVCKPCCDRRQKTGRTLAHGNMLSPAMATPRAGSGSVVRRRPGIMLPKETRSERVEGGGGEGNGPVKLRLVLKSPGKRAVRQQEKLKDSDTEESSADEFVPDSPTPSKRRRAVPALPSVTAPSPRVTRRPPPTAVLDIGAGSFTHDPQSLSMDQLLQQNGVHTSENQYKEHLLSRHTPMMTNSVIQIPAVVQRSFKPRPSALEIQQNIQNKVRQRLEAQEVGVENEEDIIGGSY